MAERTKRAGQIVQLMLRLQPALRELPEVQTRLWNHLHAMAGEEVALEAPVPLRSLRVRTEKPARVAYPRQGPKLRAYGVAVEALIAKAVTIEDASRARAGHRADWPDHEVPVPPAQQGKRQGRDHLRHLGELSGGQLKLDPAVVDSENLFEMPGWHRGHRLHRAPARSSAKAVTGARAATTARPRRRQPGQRLRQQKRQEAQERPQPGAPAAAAVIFT